MRKTRRQCGRAQALVATLLLSVLVSTPRQADGAGSDLNAVTAAYLYNFAKFVEWPERTWASPGDSLVIGVLGGPNAVSALAGTIRGRSVQGHPVALRRLSDPAQARGCQVLWVDELPRDRWPSLFASLRDSAVLTVGHETSFARKGGMIGLFMDAERLRFAVNQRAVAEGRLRLSAKLLLLADLVEEDSSGQQ